MSNLWVAIVVSVVGAALGILLLGGRLRDPKWGPILAGGLAIALLAAGIVRAGSDSARFPYLSARSSWSVWWWRSGRSGRCDRRNSPTR